MRNHGFGRCAAATAIVAVCGSAVQAADYDPTGQAGEYAQPWTSTVVHGTGAPLNVVLYVPWLTRDGIPETEGDDTPTNSAVCEIVDGEIVSGICTFGDSGPTGGADSTELNERVVAALGTCDIGGVSNDVILDEDTSTASNVFGTILPDGTFVWRANFGGTPTQNNLEFGTLPLTDPYTQTAAPTGAGTKLWDPALSGVDGTPPGSIFTGTPGAVRFGNAFYIGNSSFDLFTGAVPNSVNIWDRSGGLQNPTTPLVQWPQTSPNFSAPDRKGDPADSRQNQPLLRIVNIPGGPAKAFAVHGQGESGFLGASFNSSGSPARPFNLQIDEIPAGGSADAYADGYAIIKASDPYVVGEQFVDHKQNGSGPDVNNSSSYDMNSNGVIVVGFEDSTGALPTYEFRLYEPVFSGGTITGYTGPTVFGGSGMDGIVATHLDFNGAISALAPIQPMSGFSIDDEGRVSFTAITDEAVETNANGSFVHSTGTFFIYETGNTISNTADDTLHAVVSGGQNGDILFDKDDPNGANNATNLMLGEFTAGEETDRYCANGGSLSGRGMAVAFRPGFPNDDDTNDGNFDENGGVLNPMPGVIGPAGEEAVRGVLVIEILPPGDDCPPGCPGDATGDLMVDINDLNAVLGNFGVVGGDLCGPGDVTGDGNVDINDLNAVLGNFGSSCV